MRAEAVPARPRLTCPPILPADLHGPVASIAAAIGEVAGRYANPASTFGLELKLAYLIESRGLGSADEDRTRRPFFRLAQEPVVWSWWDALQRTPLDRDEMLALASMLNGQPVRFREREMFSHGGGRAPHVYYERLAEARAWIDDIAAADCADGDPVKTALYRFARIVCAHPFTDANGRFARAALQAGLARGGVIATPCLGLAPAFHLHAREIHAAFAALCSSGDWAAYFERMGAILSHAAQLVAEAG
jgi:hypothetical protein